MARTKPVPPTKQWFKVTELVDDKAEPVFQGSVLSSLSGFLLVVNIIIMHSRLSIGICYTDEKNLPLCVYQTLILG